MKKNISDPGLHAHIISKFCLGLTFSTLYFMGCASELNRDVANLDSQYRQVVPAEPEATPSPTPVPDTSKDLPNGSVSTGWTDMKDNILLLHLNEAQFSTSFVDTSAVSASNAVVCKTITPPTDTCPEAGAYGALENGVELNGGTHRVNVNLNAPETKNGTYVTVEFWMLWDPVIVSGNPINVMPAGFNNYAVKIHTGVVISGKTVTAIGFVTTAAGTDLWGVDSAGLSLDKRWVHVVAVFANGTNPKSSLLYIDGNLKTLSQIFGVTTTGVLKTVSQTFAIGNWASAGAGLPFKGLIDELAIYNRQLSNAEILAHYQRQAP